MAKRKGKNKISAVITFIIAAVIVISGYLYPKTAGDKTDIYLPSNSDFTASVHFIDVGQGDSALFVNNGHYVLIDSGESEYSDKVEEYCRSLGVEKFDCILVSHPHSDHAGGMADIVRDIGCDNIIIPDIDAQYITSSFYEDFIDAAAESDADIYYAYAGDKYTYGDMNFEILSPKETGKDLNNDSIVTLFTYSDISVLMTGDAEKKIEKQIINDYPALKCDVLKVGHHGSSTSSCSDFIKTVSPECAVISVGENNKYSHPSELTLKTLEENNITVYRTDYDGNVILKTNGKQYRIETEKGK